MTASRYMSAFVPEEFFVPEELVSLLVICTGDLMFGKVCGGINDKKNYENAKLTKGTL